MSTTASINSVRFNVGLRDLVWSLVLSMPFLLTHFTTPVKLPLAMLIIFGALPIMTGILMLISRYHRRNPGVLSVRMTVREGGFEIKRIFRSMQFIPLSEIRKVVSTSILDGDLGEPYTSLIIYSNSGRHVIQPELIYGTDLVDRLRAMAGWNSHAYGSRDATEGSLLNSVISKKTVLFEKSIVNDRFGEG
jgi:hypothetical protein